MKKRALVVDDEFSNRELIAALLIESQYSIYAAVNGQDAITIYEAEKRQGIDFDLFVTDLEMPVMFGDETLKYIRAKYQDPVPAVLLSGRPELDHQHYLDMGFDAVLAKPFQLPEFYETIDRAIAKCYEPGK